MRDSLGVSVLVVAAIALLVAGSDLGPGGGPRTGTRSPAPPALAVARALETPTEAGAAVTGIAGGGEAAATAAPTEASPSPVSRDYRITIPRLGIDLPVSEGDVRRDVDDQHTPENYAFHLPGTAWPGQNGNTFLYAHARRGMFLSLWNVRPGDEVFLSAPDGQNLVYVVRDILPRVPPTDVSSTRPSTAERLTLQTSTGPSASDPRFVVFAFPRSSRGSPTAR